MKNNKGFTLIEMLITMVLVIGVLIITGSAFETILKSTGRLVSSEESNIEGVVGLEMFRHDLQQAGYGLLDSFTNYDPTILYYTEASVAPANLLNDNMSASSVPRALVSIDGASGTAGADSEDTSISYNLLSGTDYLAIKATTVGRTKASQKWTYLTYSGNGGKRPNSWPNAADNLKDDDRAIVINRSFSKEGVVSSKLVFPTATPGSYWTSNATTIMNSAFNPTDQGQVHYIYGVRSYESSSSNTGLGMPFNRADYFVARPSTASSIPTTCAPDTGILYKANVNHADGKLTYMPILDCVADMQVVFGWDINGSGVIDESSAYNSDSDQISVSSSIGTTKQTIHDIMLNPDEIRKKLKYMKVYIMAQEGRKDTNYINSNTLVGNTLSVVVGEAGPNPPSNVNITKGYTAAQLTAKNWLNYRWKIYRIVVRPKNLLN